jgi:hypothetical protein
MALFVLHPSFVAGYPELDRDIAAWDSLDILHGSNLVEIPRGSLVVPRFRSIPFGAELEQEVLSSGSRLVNSYREHRSIADLYSWVHLLEGLTPPAYGIEDIPRLSEGAYFLKGETNSKKADWFTSAFAPDREALLQVAFRLMADELIGSQKLVIRPFQDYRAIGEDVTGRPIFHERRAFYYRGRLLSEAHYWSGDEYGRPEPLRPESYAAVQAEAIGRVGELAPFLVVDYAEYEDGHWGVVELNDGPMAGLSENSPEVLWAALNAAVDSEVI